MLATINDSRSDEIIAGTVVLTVGLIGNALNIAAVVMIYRTPSLHNAFGFICASHLLADVGLLTVFSFWAAPMLLFGAPESLTQSYIGKRMGQLVVLFWYASIYGQLQIALNRLLAIISPLMYSSVVCVRVWKVWKEHNNFPWKPHSLMPSWHEAPIMQALSTHDHASSVAIFELGTWGAKDGCTFAFHVDMLFWSYAKTECGQTLALYLAFFHGAILCAIVVIIDTIAFLAILKNAKKLRKSIGKAQETIMLKNNVRLYGQGCVQALCFVLAILAFHFTPGLLTTKWSRFATLTAGWEFVHAVDGLILILFHEKFRVLLCHPSSLWQKAAPPTSATPRYNFSILTEKPR
ncbi:unnamed protein product [Haemonchus placei]|uniref:7TM_GPCR_Srx domain-containing protein n=1 Tax=Haemonchus placei TaxID=6290 RepID=A0A0N4W4U5_HAEPC|nr:unnamed protein product [Haemonchus placei]